MSAYFPTGYLRESEQHVHDQRALDRLRRFQCLLCMFSVARLCNQFHTTPDTISKWRTAEKHPKAAAMKKMIKRMERMQR